MENLTGQRFGMLVVIRKTDKKQYGYLIWECRCDCGNIAYKSIQQLKHSKMASCGCYLKEFHNEQMQRTLLNGTYRNIVKRAQTVRRDSTTGIRGVTKLLNRNKYVATIYFKKKRYFLGNYDTIEEAKLSRKAAEERFYKEFIRECEENKYNSNKIIWNKEEIRQAINNFIFKNKREPVYEDFRNAVTNKLPTTHILKKLYGTYSIAIIMRKLNLDTSHNYGKWDRKNVISAIKKFNKVNGRLPTSKDLKQNKDLPYWKTITTHLRIKTMVDFKNFFEKNNE